MRQEIYSGNAGSDSAAYRGWFVGHFVEPGTELRSTAAVELKWGVHPAGEGRGWAAKPLVTTLCLLVSGRFRLEFREKDFILTTPGDYVIWGPDVLYQWKAEADSTVLTVRWPSNA